MTERHGGNITKLAAAAGMPAGEILDFSANINPLGPPEWLRPLISSLVSSLVGVLLISPVLAASLGERRGVVVQKDAPLVDRPSPDAVALANLREGEVVPLLGEEGDYLRIQDASGARGFAHQNDVRKLGVQ